MSEILVIEEDLKCPDCNKEMFVKTISDLVCKHCGSVVDRIIEGSHFVDRGTDGERMGSPESRRGKSTYFKYFDARAGEQRDFFRRLRNVDSSQYHAVEENKSRLLAILTKLGLTENERNDVLFELKKKYNSEKRKNRKITNIFLIATAIVIKHMKNKGRAVSINDIVSIFKAHNCKLSAKAVRDYIIENNMNYFSSSAREFVPKYMAKLKSNTDLRERLSFINPNDELNVEKLLTTIEKLAIKLSDIKNNSRRPSVFSVSCIFLATNLVGQRYAGQQLISKEEISRFCKIPSTTLREHCKYVMNHLELKL